MSTDPSWISELFVRIGNYANARIDREYDQTTVILEDIRQLVIANTSAPAGDTAPEGWKVVPLEPTMEMVTKANRTACMDVTGAWIIDPIRCYHAMLAAAPAAPARHIQRAGATVYQLNDRGVNRWDARVQPGRTDEGERTTDAECEAVAASICAALAAAPVEVPPNDDTRDALRFRFLCHDHDDAEMRALIGALLQRMWVMSLSAVRADIDVLMGPADRHPPTPEVAPK